MKKRSVRLGLCLMLLGLCGCSAMKGRDLAEVETIGEYAEDVMLETAAGEPRLNSVLTQRQRHSLVFGAVLSTQNQMDFETLAGLSLERQEVFVKVLAESWRISDRESAVKTLDWLQAGGHHNSSDPGYFGYDEILNSFGTIEGAEFVDELAAYESMTDYLKQSCAYSDQELQAVSTVSAWDYDRLVTLTRWCHAAGYLTEGESWNYIYQAAQSGADDYGSWREYFAGVMYGKAIGTAALQVPVEDQTAAELLLGQKSVYQVYPLQP